VPATSGSFLTVNADEQTTSGLELEATWQPTSEWRISANYTHLFKNRTSFPVAAGTPRPEDWLANRFGSIIVNYQRGKWNFNLNGTLRAEAKVLPQGTTAVFSLI